MKNDWENNSPQKKEIAEYKKALFDFFSKMQNPEIKPWYEIIQKRSSAQSIMAKSMGIKESNYEYWAKGHFDEYMLRINSDDENVKLDEEGLRLRIKVFNEIIHGLEIIIKKAIELKLNVIGIACLTNYAAGISEHPLTHEEVVSSAENANQNFCKLIEIIINNI